MNWYVLRDLSRPNAKTPAYRQLNDCDGLEVFTPMQWRVTTRNGRRERQEVPVVHDLLFVRAERTMLDPIVEHIDTLQYRFLRGAPFGTPMTVRPDEMDRFIAAVNASPTLNVLYYSPDEITPSMYGRMIDIVGGPLDGFTGRLLSIRGMRTRRLLVELPGLLTAAVEVQPEYIRFTSELTS